MEYRSVFAETYSRYLPYCILYDSDGCTEDFSMLYRDGLPPSVFSAYVSILTRLDWGGGRTLLAVSSRLSSFIQLPIINWSRSLNWKDSGCRCYHLSPEFSLCNLVPFSIWNDICGCLTCLKLSTPFRGETLSQPWWISLELNVSLRTEFIELVMMRVQAGTWLEREMKRSRR